MASFKMYITSPDNYIWADIIGDNLTCNGIPFTGGYSVQIISEGTYFLLEGDNVTKLKFSSTNFLNVFIYDLSPEMTSINSMFWGCDGMTDFAVARPGVTSNITDMSMAWFMCEHLTEFPDIDTSLVTSLDSTWSRCTRLSKFPEIDTSACTNLSYTWSGCATLYRITNLDTTGLTGNGDDTFKDCPNLTTPAPTGTNVREGDNAIKGGVFPEPIPPDTYFVKEVVNGAYGLTHKAGEVFKRETFIEEVLFTVTQPDPNILKDKVTILTDIPSNVIKYPEKDPLNTRAELTPCTNFTYELRSSADNTLLDKIEGVTFTGVYNGSSLVILTKETNSITFKEPAWSCPTTFTLVGLETHVKEAIFVPGSFGGQFTFDGLNPCTDYIITATGSCAGGTITDVLEDKTRC